MTTEIARGTNVNLSYLIIFFILSVVYVLIIVDVMESPIVTINDGKIQGNQRTNLNEEKFYSFLAIPYAKPPVGDLRFKAPEPVEPWTNVKDATKEGPPCYQKNDLTHVFEGSESDCLHLNVYTKKLPAEEKTLNPVMVWIHGGGFRHGNNRPSLYGPEFLMTENIVLVAINYRLGFLGFLHLNDDTLDVPGNAALKDQRLALQWVQKNIKYFNGDPNDVTLFGESAGSACVHYHIVSPTSKGLFHKAILQSGTLHNPWAYSNDVALEFAQSISKEVKNEKEALKLLRSLPVEDLYDYQEKYCNVKGFWGVTAPNVEYPNKTEFITSPPIELLASGLYNKVPIMLGFTGREGLLLVIKNQGKAVGLENYKEMDLDSFVHPHLNLKKGDPKRQFIIKKYEDFYFRGENAKDKVMLMTDFFFLTGIIASAKLHVKTSSTPIYMYRMSIDAGLNMLKKIKRVNEPGACHADDLGYLFDVHIAAKILRKGPLEEKVIKYFVKLWTNFARTGNPTPDGNNLNILWKPINEKEMNYLDIDEELTLHTNPEPERMNFWREIFQLSFSTTNYL